MTLKSMYDGRYIADLAAAVREVHPTFDGEGFVALVFDEGWAARELKARMRHIARALHSFLPGDYHTALGILRRVAPSLHNYGFENIVLCDYVEAYGLDDWEVSIPALEQFTRLISAEFAIRPFIVRDQGRTMDIMQEWARSGDSSLRRLASEGCRPRLPWGIALNALKADPSPILPILEQLKLDASDNVRLSVSNNLNDISKDHPDVVIDVLRRWQAAHDTKEMRRLIRHALRTLLKAGHPAALELLGYPTAPAIAVRDLSVTPHSIPMGGQVRLSFAVVSTGDVPQNLMIDYVVHLVRARGQRTPKVFKLTVRTIQPDQVLHIEKSVSFRPVTTRRYYPGEHAVEIQINGQVYGRVQFDLCQEG
jgi:3-methyladenine DNA glycosylase AlkC